MNLGTKIAVGALIISAVGAPVAVNLPSWIGDATNNAKQAATGHVRQACDSALGAAEREAVRTGQTGPAALEKSMTAADPRYAVVWKTVADSLPAQQVGKAGHSALSAAAGPKERQRWHNEAVEVCTKQLLARVGM